MKIISLLAAALLATGTVQAHEGAAHASPSAAASVDDEAHPWGRAGRSRDVRRTIDITMSDRMRFSPDVLQVRQGETVRLRVRNAGRLLHELVIGTAEALDAHAEAMRKFPGMEHSAPYMAHVPAGQRGELVWTFDQPGSFRFACLIEGHYQAGMVGRIDVKGNQP